MPTSQRRRDRGAHDGRRLGRTLGEELRSARLAAGLSQVRVGAAVGISGVHVGRLERASVPDASLRLYAMLFAVLGMRLSARPYPEGPPIRDAAHARLLARLRSRLPAGIRMLTEVPLPAEGDLRSWDALLDDGLGQVAVEAETALHDLQAIDRRIAHKMADGAIGCVILLVADTKRNRRVLREFSELLAARYTLTSRQVLAGIRSGGLPDESGVVVLSAAPRESHDRPLALSTS